MNIIDDLDEIKERWFFLPGGGKVMFRTISPEKFKEIQQKTVKKKIEFKKVEGTPGRFEVETVDSELQTKLFWDESIGSWDEFTFRLPGTKELINCTPETCTIENKFILISHSKKFLKFANESLETLNKEEAAQAKIKKDKEEAEEKD